MSFLFYLDLLPKEIDMYLPDEGMKNLKNHSKRKF